MEGRPKTTDLGEKLDPQHLVFEQAKAFQSAVIAGKGSVFGRRYGGWLCLLAWNHFGKTF